MQCTLSYNTQLSCYYMDPWINTTTYSYVCPTFSWSKNTTYMVLYSKNSLKAQNVEKWMWGWRNLVWLLIYSTVWKGHKENPDQVNGDYLSVYISLFFLTFKFRVKRMEGKHRKRKLFLGSELFFCLFDFTWHDSSSTQSISSLLEYNLDVF